MTDPRDAARDALMETVRDTVTMVLGYDGDDDVALESVLAAVRKAADALVVAELRAVATAEMRDWGPIIARVTQLEEASA